MCYDFLRLIELSDHFKIIATHCKVANHSNRNLKSTISVQTFAYPELNISLVLSLYINKPAEWNHLHSWKPMITFHKVDDESQRSTDTG